MTESTWTPDRKIVAAAVAAVLAWLAQVIGGIEVPAGVEAAVAVIVAYLVPSTSGTPLEESVE